MGWLDTVLSAASAGASLYNVSQLQTLRQQGAQAALIQAMLAHLRDQIFQFKQMTEYGLAQEAQSVKRAAGIISIVASRLDDSGITPELFPNLGDKEYAMQTIRLIGENRRRLLGLLSRDEQAEISLVVSAADRLPDYNYYAENYNDGRRLADAENAVTQYAGRNGCLAQIGLLAYAFVGIPAIAALSGAMLGGGNWSSSGSQTGLVIGAILGLVSFFIIARGMHAKDYKQAKRVVDELKDKIDLPRFAALDNELGSTTRARQLLQDAQNLLAPFFGEPTTPSAPAYMPASRQYNHPAPEVDYTLPGAPAAQVDDTLSGAPPAASQSTTCSDCGEPMGPNSRFCPSCGHKLASPAPQTASPARTPRASVLKRLGAVQSNAEVTRGPADSSGNAPWLVGKKGQQAAAEPFLDIQCPWCGQRYCVNAQPAHLELFCLACGQGMWVDVE